MILVTHDVIEAFTLGDSICLMDQGCVQQLGKPQDLLFRPANDFVRQFFTGDRLTLELMITTFSEVRPWLQASQNAFPSELSLMTLLSSEDMQQSFREDLLRAFYQYKTSFA